MNAVYNEIEPFVASWLERLIDGGHIAAGRVDRRSIADLTAAEVAGPGQRHFFAGIGGWSAALRLAGVPDDAGIWTGSCPCQPFSSAGKRGGVRDARHLWPAWFALIEQCRPPVIFGEQVASLDGLAWLDLVLADLERCGYAVGAADLCAAGVGAPHARQRLYFVAHADATRLGELWGARLRAIGAHHSVVHPDRRGASVRVDDAAGGTGGLGVREGQDEEDIERTARRASRQRTATSGARSGLGNPDGLAGRRHRGAVPRAQGEDAIMRSHTDGSRAPGLVMDPWRDARWIDCADGKRRPAPTEPALFPLAHGVPNRVGLLRGSGNAIVPQQAAMFIRAALGAWR